jgi:hypothetical protein
MTAKPLVANASICAYFSFNVGEVNMEVGRDVVRNLVVASSIGAMPGPGAEQRATDVSPARSRASERLISWKPRLPPAGLLFGLSAVSGLAGSAIMFRLAKKRWPWQRPQVNPFVQHEQLRSGRV